MNLGPIVNHLLNANETKIIYYIDDEDTPYAQRLPIPPDSITLADFKSILVPPRPNCKFFFKSTDDDIGPVKEEVIEDSAKLPLFKGRVVAYLVAAEGSNVSDGNSQYTDQSQRMVKNGHMEQRTHSYHMNHDAEFSTDTDSCVSSRRAPYHRGKNGRNRTPEHNHHHHQSSGQHGRSYRPHYGNCDSSSVMTSDIESTSFVDSEDDEDETTSRVSTTTDETSVSRTQERSRRRRTRRTRMPSLSRNSSISSITDSTTSLNIITVILNLDTVNFLGISIVGQSNNGDGDGGIYVGSIMKGGAVAIDGRIEPGDMILQVNETNFENMNNDEAVHVLREAVKQPGPIKLVVAKCWDPNPKGYFTINKGDPVCPIDPGAWVAHTEAARSVPEGYMRPPSANTLTSNSSSLPSSLPDNDRQALTQTDAGNVPITDLSVEMNMISIAKAMASHESGLEVKDRQWLKVTIRNAFLGSEVVSWLTQCVRGLQDRSDAKKYAAQMLKFGYIKNALNKGSFSGNCYYTFGDSIALEQLQTLSIEGQDPNREQLFMDPNEAPVWLGPTADRNQSPNQFPQQYNPPMAAFMHNWGGNFVNYGVFGANIARNQDGSARSSGGSGNGVRGHQISGSGHGSGSPSNSDQDQISQRSGPFAAKNGHGGNHHRGEGATHNGMFNRNQMTNGSTASSDLGSGCAENTYCEPDISIGPRDNGQQQFANTDGMQMHSGQTHKQQQLPGDFSEEEEDHLIIEYHYPDKALL